MCSFCVKPLVQLGARLFFVDNARSIALTNDIHDGSSV
jgi:hypothetical protein